MTPILSPVITIDGPSGCGKGTVSQRLASYLKWHFLDSGSLYRVLALACLQAAVPLEDEQAIAKLASSLPVRFKEHHLGEAPEVYLNEIEVSDAIRSENCGKTASLVSSLPSVRTALLARQRAFRRPPGLVTDGRDMGTVVFPDAKLKIFLDASPEERARRRFQQLKNKGVEANYEVILNDLISRDERDRCRTIAPLIPAKDAILIDSTELDAQAVFDRILKLIRV